MIGNCKHCGIEKELEAHHIVPKSLGGTDDKQNIVMLCGSCHGKAHNANFKDNRKGLIAKGIERRKQKDSIALGWWNKYDKEVDNVLWELMEEDENVYEFLISGMHLGFIAPSHIYDLFHKGSTQIRGTLRKQLRIKVK